MSTKQVTIESEFVELMKVIRDKCHQKSVDHGFWGEKCKECHGQGSREVGGKGYTEPCTLCENGFMTDWNFGEKIALMHSELSEALEKHRKTIGKGKPDDPDEHCPEHGGITVEFADAVIRILDLCGKMKIDLGSAIIAKMTFNATRPIKHGKAY